MLDPDEELQSKLAALTLPAQQRVQSVLKVMAFLGEGRTQAEACQAAGVALRSYQRWIADETVLQFVREAAAQSIAGAVAAAVGSLPEALAETARVARGGQGISAAAQLNAQKEIAGWVVRFVAQIPQQPAEPEAEGDEERQPLAPDGARPGFKPRTFSLEPPRQRVIEQGEIGSLIEHAVSGESER